MFEVILDGTKKIETRAATKKFRGLKVGDVVVLVCGNRKAKKRIKTVELLRSMGAVLKKYKPVDINPNTQTAKEIKKMWLSFPGYKEKIKKHGLAAMQLE